MLLALASVLFSVSSLTFLSVVLPAWVKDLAMVLTPTFRLCSLNSMDPAILPVFRCLAVLPPSSVNNTAEVKSRKKIWKPEMVIRGEGESQPQRIGSAIMIPRGREYLSIYLRIKDMLTTTKLNVVKYRIKSRYGNIRVLLLPLALLLLSSCGSDLLVDDPTPGAAALAAPIFGGFYVEFQKNCFHCSRSFAYCTPSSDVDLWYLQF